MLGKCASGRKVSPLMAFLLSVLAIYSFLLFKRVQHQQSLTLSRRRKAISANTREDKSLLDTFHAKASSLFLHQDWEQDESYLEDQIGLYIITPTYPRPEQLPELTRLSQTLMHVKNMLWIVAEDSSTPTYKVLELLKRLEPVLPNVYLSAPMPEIYRQTKDEYHLPKGVSNRNKGLEWILNYGVDNAVVYFADDDNTYDLRLFHELRKTKKVSMLPVGLVSGSPVSTPIVQDGQYSGFYVGWDGNRKFPLDMAGFAFSVKYFRELSAQKPVSMPYIRGYEEDGFLKQLQITRQTLEILSPDKILVWHTRTTKTLFKPFKRISKSDYLNTNLGPLSEYWCLFMGPYKCRNNGDKSELHFKKKSEMDGYKLT